MIVISDYALNNLQSMIIHGSRSCNIVTLSLNSQSSHPRRLQLVEIVALSFRKLCEKEEYLISCSPTGYSVDKS